MKPITCIVCPNGCELTLENGTVSGNLCKRGEGFAFQEWNDPHRSVTSTLKTVFSDFPMVPCRTDRDIPKDKVFEVIEAINQVTIEEPLEIGSVVIDHVAGTDANIVTTRKIMAGEYYD